MDHCILYLYNKQNKWLGEFETIKDKHRMIFLDTSSISEGIRIIKEFKTEVNAVILESEQNKGKIWGKSFLEFIMKEFKSTPVFILLNQNLKSSLKDLSDNVFFRFKKRLTTEQLLNEIDDYIVKHQKLRYINPDSFGKKCTGVKGLVYVVCTDTHSKGKDKSPLKYFSDDKNPVGARKKTIELINKKGHPDGWYSIELQVYFEKEKDNYTIIVNYPKILSRKEQLEYLHFEFLLYDINKFPVDESDIQIVKFDDDAYIKVLKGILDDEGEDLFFKKRKLKQAQK